MASTVTRGPFTWTREPTGEEAVREDLSAVIRCTTRTRAPSLVSLYLFGSFALGEGLLFRAGKRWLSDEPYRLLIVPDAGPFPEKWVEDVKSGLALELHNPKVELNQIPFPELQELSACLLHADICKSALLLWGNPGSLLRLRPYSPEAISLLEGEALLDEGARQLLLSCPRREDDGEELPAALYAGHALFSLASSLLIPLRKYHPSLRIRRRWIKEEFANFPSLAELLGRCVHFRTSPCDPFDLEDWLAYRAAFLRGALRYLNWLYAYGEPFADIRSFVSFHSNLYGKEGAKASLRIGLSLLLAYPGETGEERLIMQGARRSMPAGTADRSGELSWGEAVEQFLEPGGTGSGGRSTGVTPAVESQDRGIRDNG